MTLAFPKKPKMPPKVSGKDSKRLKALGHLPCIICHVEGLTQTSKTTRHHCKSGRFSQKKRIDKYTIPLCDCHHQGIQWDRDRSKVAFHQDQAGWEALYGPDYDWLPIVNEMLASHESIAWST